MSGQKLAARSEWQEYQEQGKVFVFVFVVCFVVERKKTKNGREKQEFEENKCEDVSVSKQKKMVCHPITNPRKTTFCLFLDFCFFG